MTRVLLICTANQCRSPMAAGLLRLRLSERAHGSAVQVRSAGLLPGGYPAADEAIARMRGYGIDLSGHVSTEVGAELLDDADLILTMTRRHVRALVADDPRLRARAFTIKDFVRRAHEALVHNSAQEESFDLAGLCARLDERRPRGDLLGGSADDDVTDPMGRAAAVWHGVVTELDEATALLATLLDR